MMARDGSSRGPRSRIVLVWMLASAALPWPVAVGGLYPGGVWGRESSAAMWIQLGLLVGFLGTAAVLGVVSIVLVIRHLRRGGRGLPRRRWMMLTPLVFVSGVLAFEFDAPRRVGFYFARPTLDRLAGQESRPRLPVWAGPYNVLDISRDPRGGIYLKTGESPNIIDTFSFGFVKDPNPEGSPFGAADYSLTHIGGGWHTFTANNDSF